MITYSGLNADTLEAAIADPNSGISTTVLESIFGVPYTVDVADGVDADGGFITEFVSRPVDADSGAPTIRTSTDAPNVYDVGLNGEFVSFTTSNGQVVPIDGADVAVVTDAIANLMDEIGFDAGQYITTGPGFTIQGLNNTIVEFFTDTNNADDTVVFSLDYNQTISASLVDGVITYSGLYGGENHNIIIDDTGTPVIGTGANDEASSLLLAAGFLSSDQFGLDTVKVRWGGGDAAQTATITKDGDSFVVDRDSTSSVLDAQAFAYIVSNGQPVVVGSTIDDDEGNFVRQFGFSV